MKYTTTTAWWVKKVNGTESCNIFSTDMLQLFEEDIMDAQNLYVALTFFGAKFCIF